MTSRTVTRAIVKVKVEVKLSDTWSPETQLAQVYKQAVDGATQKLNRIFSEEAIGIIEKAEVEMVLTKEKS
jgi:hypothetical protein